MKWFVATVALCCTTGVHAEEVIKRIAFGSCSFQSVPQPIFRKIADSKPDLYISLGDVIYADYDLEVKKPYEVTAESLQREWQVMKSSPDWQYLVSRVSVMATWDNHDYGHYQAGEEFELKEVSKKIFLNFFDEPKDSDRRKRAGIYDAKIIGPEGRRVQIILLGTRSFKTRPVLAQRPEGAKGSLGKFAPNTDPAASLLGDAQWQWLVRELKRTAELRLLVSSTQIVADQKGMDEWGAYPLKRQRLFNLLKGLDVGNLIVLSGNAHFAEISEYRSGGFRLIDFTSSGLTHTDKEYAQAPNRYRIAKPYIGNNFGLVKIDWLAGGLPHVELAVMDENGKQVLANTVNFTERKGEK